MDQRAGFAILGIALLATASAGAEPLFESRQLTPSGEYTFGIEGPAVDAAGNLYVVNHLRQGTIGKVATGAARSEPFATLPQGSIGVSIRFGRDRMYVADYKGHNIFVFEPGATTPRVYFHSDRFNQPNDMALGRDGTLYASDPNWRRRDGQVWRIVPGPDGTVRGDVMASERKLTTTNGIDLSPDEKTLYVAESETREIWAYRLDGGKLAAPRLIKRFPDFSLDGIRTDIDGRICGAHPEGTIARSARRPRVARYRVARRRATNPASGGGRKPSTSRSAGRLGRDVPVDRPTRVLPAGTPPTRRAGSGARAYCVA